MKVVPLKPVDPAPMTDAPAMLRKLADDLERDIEAYGEGCICRVVCVVRFSRQVPGVYAFGDVEHLSQSYMDLHAGAQELMSMTSPGRD